VKLYNICNEGFLPQIACLIRAWFKTRVLDNNDDDKDKKNWEQRNILLSRGLICLIIKNWVKYVFNPYILRPFEE